MTGEGGLTPSKSDALAAPSQWVGMGTGAKPEVATAGRTFSDSFASLGERGLGVMGTTCLRENKNAQCLRLEHIRGRWR